MVTGSKMSVTDQDRTHTITGSLTGVLRTEEDAVYDLCAVDMCKITGYTVLTVTELSVHGITCVLWLIITGVATLGCNVS